MAGRVALYGWGTLEDQSDKTSDARQPVFKQKRKLRHCS